jgi:hypothetical protein
VNGSLALLDTRTPEITTGETVLAHTGGISQLEAEGNYVVTVGYTMRFVRRASSASFAFQCLISIRCSQTRSPSSRSLPQTSRHSFPSTFVTHSFPNSSSSRSLPPSTVRKRRRCFSRRSSSTPRSQRRLEILSISSRSQFNVDLDGDFSHR